MGNIIAENELMKNQKAAEVLPAQAHFAALQTANGSSVFFAIGDTHVLSLIVEQPGDETGWQQVDISSELSAQHNGAAITAETFAVSQAKGTGQISVALSIKAQGDDASYLYLLTGLSDAAGADWMTKDGTRSWLARPYDDTAHPLTALAISALYLPPPNAGTSAPALICEASVNGYLQNYTVNLTGSHAWKQLQTAENFQSVLGQVIGKPQASQFPGLYQLTDLNGGLTIDFVPMESMFGPPTVIKLNAPAGATRIATTPADGQNTNLFISADKGIYLFTPDKQTNFGNAAQIIASDMVTGIREFYVHQSDTLTALFALNQQGDVLHTTCPKGSEADPTAWLAPVPILTDVEQIASYVCSDDGNNVLFAHTSGQTLTRMVQDADTSNWQKSQIMLPAPDVKTVLEYNTITSHIQLASDDNLPLGNTKVKITSTSDCSVFINNIYYELSPTVPVEIQTDATGQASIVQQTDSIAAVCYHITTDDGQLATDVNPMLKMVDKLSAVKSGSDLASVQVTNADGTKQPLVGSDVTQDQKDSTAAAIQNFVDVSKKMPQDGSQHQPAAATSKAALMALPASDFTATEDTIWGVSYEGGTWQYHSGATAMAKFGLVVHPATNTFAVQSQAVQLSSIWDAIETTAGDIWNWLKHAYNDVKNFFIKVVDDVYHFFIEIAGKLYRFILDSVKNVMHAVEFVFNKIKVFMEDLIKWLGFLFEWSDIIRTHNALKNIIKQFIGNAANQGDAMKASLGKVFKDLESQIDSWAGLENEQTTLSDKAAKTSSVQGQHSPQNHYGSTHLKHGLKAATADTASQDLTDKMTQLMDDLKQAIDKEGDIFETAFNKLKTQVIDQFATLPLGDIIKRLVGIIGDILIESVQNIIDTAIDVIVLLIEGMLDVFDATIDIPVLSWLYKEITGNDLSLLDVVCLALAIPGTLVYKITMGSAPFPDNSTTAAIISATSWDALRQVYGSAQPVNMASGKLMMAAALDDNSGLKTGLIIFMRIVSAFGSVLFVGINTVKTTINTLQIQSRAANVVQAICFYCTTGPNFASGLISSTVQRWDVITGEAIYGLTSLEKFADIFNYQPQVRAAWGTPTKVVDLLLGIAGLVPAISAPVYNPGVKSITGCITNVAWNANRVCTAFASFESEAQAAVFAVKQGLILFFGLGQLALMVEEIAIGEEVSTAPAG